MCTDDAEICNDPRNQNADVMTAGQLCMVNDERERQLLVESVKNPRLLCNK